MSKYLSEIELSAANRFGKNKARGFVERTRHFVFALSPFSRLCPLGKREVRSKFRKIVIKLWPEEWIDNKAMPIGRYGLDDMSSVCVINIPYNIDLFLQAENDDRNRIVYEIIKDVCSDLPDEIGLDGRIVLDQLEKFKNGGFLLEEYSARAVRSPSKKLKARLHYLFDASGIRVEALVGLVGKRDEIPVLIGKYNPCECCTIVEVPAKLEFISEDFIEFVPKHSKFATVRVPVPADLRRCEQ